MEKVDDLKGVFSLVGVGDFGEAATGDSGAFSADESPSDIFSSDMSPRVSSRKCVTATCRRLYWWYTCDSVTLCLMLRRRNTQRNPDRISSSGVCGRTVAFCVKCRFRLASGERRGLLVPKD